jgi:hypothetical protein
MTVGAMVMLVDAPSTGETRWVKLLEEFKGKFSDISL